MTWQEEVIERLKETRSGLLQLRPDLWVIQSNTDEMQFYYLNYIQKRDGTWIWTCDCKSFRYRDTCTHLKGFQ